MATSAFVEIGNDIIVDDSLFSRLPHKEKENFFRNIPQGKVPVFVQSFMQAKDVSNIREAAMRGEDVRVRISLAVGRELTADEIAAVTSLEQCIRSFNDLLDAHKPDYPFVDVPQGKSIEKFVWNKVSVKRGRGEYSIGFKELSNLWNHVKDYWAGKTSEKPKEFYAKSTTGYGRWAEFDRNQIDIGCQRIQRWELEQIALKLNFVFPEGTKANAEVQSTAE